MDNDPRASTPEWSSTTRPRLVSVVGWFFFAISCWMTLSVVMYVVVAWGLGMGLAETELAARIWSSVAWLEIVLGPAMIVTSLRFLQLRRWTRLPLAGFAAILVVGMIAFSVFWVIKMGGFFREMRGGPPLDSTGSLVIGGFQIVMTVGGVLVSLAFAAGFGMLLKHLLSPAVRQSVTRNGF